MRLVTISMVKATRPPACKRSLAIHRATSTRLPVVAALFRNTTGFKQDWGRRFWSNTSGSVNCAFGTMHLALYGTACAFGKSALHLNTTVTRTRQSGLTRLRTILAQLNTAVGTSALGNTGDGTQNTATGANALASEHDWRFQYGDGS